MPQEPSAPETETVLPLVAEELSVGKRRVETARVRVSTVVREREELVRQSLQGEEVEIERVPVGTVVAEPPPVRQEGDTIIVPLLEEVVVFERRLLLREEVRIHKRRTESQVEHTVTLRSEDIVVDRQELRPEHPKQSENMEE